MPCFIIQIIYNQIFNLESDNTCKKNFDTFAACSTSIFQGLASDLKKAETGQKAQNIMHQHVLKKAARVALKSAVKAVKKAKKN